VEYTIRPDLAGQTPLLLRVRVDER
jgi:hypothetical protein